MFKKENKNLLNLEKEDKTKSLEVLYFAVYKSKCLNAYCKNFLYAFILEVICQSLSSHCLLFKQCVCYSKSVLLYYNNLFQVSTADSYTQKDRPKPIRMALPRVRGAVSSDHANTVSSQCAELIITRRGHLSGSGISCSVERVCRNGHEEE